MTTVRIGRRCGCAPCDESGSGTGVYDVNTDCCPAVPSVLNLYLDFPGHPMDGYTVALTYIGGVTWFVDNPPDGASEAPIDIGLSCIPDGLGGYKWFLAFDYASLTPAAGSPPYCPFTGGGDALTESCDPFELTFELYADYTGMGGAGSCGGEGPFTGTATVIP